MGQETSTSPTPSRTAILCNRTSIYKKIAHRVLSINKLGINKMLLSDEMQLRRELITCIRLINGLLVITYLAGAVYAVTVAVRLITG
jgi:hypothetical protein